MKAEITYWRPHNGGTMPQVTEFETFEGEDIRLITGGGQSEPTFCIYVDDILKMKVSPNHFIAFKIL